jgi:hypothetical protein
VFGPGVRQNLPHLLAFFILAKLPMLVVVICSMFYRRLWRALLWWPLFLGFTMIKRLANIEALLLLRTMPVSPTWWRHAERAQPSSDTKWPVLRPHYLCEADAVIDEI